MWVLKIILFLVAAYVALVAMMYFTQTGTLFPTYLVLATDEGLPASARKLEVATPDGERLHGVHIPAARADPAGAPLLVLGFGGNAWSANSMADYLHGLYPHADVAAFHYRGYRPSTGKPSAAALLADAPIIYDHLKGTLGTKRVVAVGLSIGAGVAAALASQRPLAGLILVSPFDSLEALARDHYPWVPVRWLLRHKIPTADFVRGLEIPVALIAAEYDTIVPPRRTEALRQVITALVLDRTIARAGHNDLYHRPDFQAAMGDALERME